MCLTVLYVHKKSDQCFGQCVWISLEMPVIHVHLRLRLYLYRPQDDGIMENFLVVNCFSPGSFIWQLSIYLYIAIMHACTLVLAFRTRKVKISVLKETKELTIIVCVGTFVSVQTIVFGFLLQDYNNVQEIFFNSGLIILTTTFLVLLYVPKVSLPKSAHHIVSAVYTCCMQAAIIPVMLQCNLLIYWC